MHGPAFEDGSQAQEDHRTDRVEEESLASLKRQERFDQSYFSFSSEASSWKAVTPSRTASTATAIAKFSLMSWNIDFMLPYTDERMLPAIKHIQSHINTASLPTIIMLQEMLETDLALLQAQQWVRENYYMTDIDNNFWESGHYGTCTLIPKVLYVTSVFRVHYEQTGMERDGLFVDIDFGNGQIIRVCNTHLESLIADPPKRPHQMATAARWMHSSEVSGSVLGGDLNAIQPFDERLHSDNDLRDAYLALGGAEHSDEGYTWGQMAPTKLRKMFGCSRMDKFFFCGGLKCERFERFGYGVEVEDEAIKHALVNEEGVEAGWVTDHLGVKADFGIETSSSSKI